MERSSDANSSSVNLASSTVRFRSRLPETDRKWVSGRLLLYAVLVAGCRFWCLRLPKQRRRERARALYGPEAVRNVPDANDGATAVDDDGATGPPLRNACTPSLGADEGKSAAKGYKWLAFEKVAVGEIGASCERSSAATLSFYERAAASARIRLKSRAKQGKVHKFDQAKQSKAT